MCLHLNGILNKVVPCNNAHLVSKTNQSPPSSSGALMRDILTVPEEQLSYLALTNTGVKGKFLPPVSKRKIASAFSFTPLPCCWELTFCWRYNSAILLQGHLAMLTGKCLFISFNKKYVLRVKRLPLGKDSFLPRKAF